MYVCVCAGILAIDIQLCASNSFRDSWIYLLMHVSMQNGGAKKGTNMYVCLCEEEWERTNEKSISRKYEPAVKKRPHWNVDCNWRRPGQILIHKPRIDTHTNHTSSLLKFSTNWIVEKKLFFLQMKNATRSDFYRFKNVSIRICISNCCG